MVLSGFPKKKKSLNKTKRQSAGRKIPKTRDMALNRKSRANRDAKKAAPENFPETAFGFP
jgi:hypothetical protein